MIKFLGPDRSDIVTVLTVRIKPSSEGAKGGVKPYSLIEIHQRLGGTHSVICTTLLPEDGDSTFL